MKKAGKPVDPPSPAPPAAPAPAPLPAPPPAPPPAPTPPSAVVQSVAEPAAEAKDAPAAPAAPAADAASAAAAAAATTAPEPGCRARIFHVNDIYVLDHLPALKTCVAKESQGFAPENIITTLAGDFLGPSLLSSLDHGKGMVDCLNKVPVNAVCFGNHESDVPFPSLVRRIGEFNGVWLNSNMPTFEPKCPEHHLFEFAGGRSVAMIGLNIGGGANASLYRDGGGKYV
jgi:hypothetical protein